MNHERLIDVDFRRQHRVRWRETDASGFVHFTNYIRMMEQTEYAFLRSLGLSIVMHDEKGVFGFPRRSTEIEVHQPAQLDDELENDEPLDNLQRCLDLLNLDKKTCAPGNGRSPV